jgi:DNA polymerase-3 subunit delta'
MVKQGQEMAWQIVGHNWAVTLLRRGLASGRVAHAYLLCGPPQIGKTRLALTLAQALNCQAADPPCGHCPSCQKIERGAHPDVHLLTGEGAGGSFKIDQVRALQREAVLSPYESRYRVYILERMDLASVEAANSLLKTLEEPPAHVVLALTAVQADALPTTVVSRCQRLDLRPVTRDLIEATLQERGLPAEKARLLARLSGGRVGWALVAAEDDGLLARRQRALEQMLQLMAANRVERLEFARRTARDADACLDLVEQWAIWWRDLLLAAGQGQEHLVNVDRAAELQSLAGEAGVARAWAMLNALRDTAAQLQANVNPRLALEGLLLKLPSGRVTAS